MLAYVGFLEIYLPMKMYHNSVNYILDVENMIE